MIEQPTKKLEELLRKYKKANRARLNAYAARSRALGGVWDNKQNKRVFRVPITDALKAELDANIETARVEKLKVSAELRAYCKKKKYHIAWGDSNQVNDILSHWAWKLQNAGNKGGDTLLKVMYNLKLSTKHRWYF